MRVKRLELLGFKSFKDKTVVHFDEGITGIVGPNGCGKSNVVDAFFWVMGEMSSKHLRGSSMADLIFNGSEKYPAANFAEVALILDMENGYQPIDPKAYPSGASSNPALFKDASEISIARRVYRSGETEYLINRVTCRLRDIQEFFMDTGLGPKAYSVIAQGEIDRITMQKPEDRRTLIEEVAGISKYKKRKQESLRKIEATQQNLLRVNDIISEIDKQLRSLERQAKKAAQYKTFKDELKEKELKLNAHKVSKFLKSVQNSRNELNELQIKELELRTALEQGELQIETQKISQLDLSKELDVYQAQVIELSQNVNRLENNIEYAKKSIHDIELKFTNENEELSQIQSQIESLTEEHAVELGLASEIEATAGSEEIQISTLSETLYSKKEELNSTESWIEETKKRCIQLVSEVTSLQNSIEHTKENLSRVRLESEKLVSSKRGKEETRDALSTTLSTKKVTLSHLRVNLERVTTELSEIESSLKEDREHFTEKTSETDRLTKEHSRVSSRLQTLIQLKESFEGLKEGAREILKRSKENENSSIRGILGDFIQVDAGYETAVDSYLGDTLQSIITTTNSDSLIEAISREIEFLKTSDAGRAEFITSSRTQAPTNSSISIPEGTLGSLIQFVKPEEQVANLVQELLRNTYLVQDLRVAMRLHEEHSNLNFVTLDGETLSAEGIIRGGSKKALEAGIFAKKREIEEASESENSLLKKLEILEEEIEELKSKIEEKTASSESLKDQRSEIQIELQIAEQELGSKQAELLALEADLATSETEITRLQDEGRRFSSKISEDESLLTSSNLEKETLETKLYEKNILSNQLRSETQQISDELTQLKVQDASRKERLISSKKRISEIERTLDQIQNRSGHLSQSLEEQESEKVRLTEELSQNEEKIKEAVDQLQAKKEQYNQIKSQYDTIGNSISELYEKTKQERRTLEQTTIRQRDLSLQLEKDSMEEEHLSKNILEKYRVDLREAVSPLIGIHEFTSIVEVIQRERAEVEAMPTEQLEFSETENSEEAEEAPLQFYEYDPNEDINEAFLDKRVSFLKSRLREIGEVNVSAIEEYDRLKIRFDFLEGQRGDLMRSLADLEEAIDKINSTSVERFKTAFEEVNNKFQKVFPIIFGGGNAQLVMTNSEDLLETGIDIIAQPPGKKNQSITLLSGGEKAMTAISLLFSIFLIKPSPFCLLDEVDAPLDDANIGRYNDLLREMSKKSQFIVVTHNKRTMELNDRLYGVTMQEPGISSVVNVQVQ